MISLRAPPLVEAAQTASRLQAALAYARLGLSVLPLNGKRPTVRWQALQQTPASPTQLMDWAHRGLLRNVGLICGAVSHNLVVLDVDTEAGYSAFTAAFPHLSATYTVCTGGGVGRHLYWQVECLPPTMRVQTGMLGTLELLAHGCQVVAPPSIHPLTGRLYQVEHPLPLLVLPDLNAVVDWFSELPRNTPRRPVRQQHTPLPGTAHLNPRVVDALAAYFECQGYRRHGIWFNGRCLFPHQHCNGDAHPSFGFNLVSGYGHCFVCGTILARDLCRVVGIDPMSLGGLLAQSP